MIISDALPIQFWLNGQESYNQSIEHEEFVDEVCFHQEIKCTEEQHVQFREIFDDSAEYELLFEDVDGNEISSLPFVVTTPQVIENGDFSTNLDGWDQTSFLADQTRMWAWSGGRAEATIAANIIINNNTLVIGQTVINPSLNYKLDVTAFLNSAANVPIGLRFIMVLYNGPTVVSETILHTFAQTVDVHGIAGYDVLAVDLVGVTAIGFRFELTSTATEDTDVSLDNIELTAEDTLSTADLFFTPSVVGLCDRPVVMRIMNVAEEPAVELAYTDVVLISTEPQTSIVMSYKSSKNYASLIYTSTSSYFTLRIPARFYHWRNSTEVEAEELSNSVIIDVAFTLKKQRLLTVGHMPEYMHTKIQLALAHAIAGSVLIKGYEWIMEEGYELIDVKAPEFPLKAANVYLTRRNYVSRNVM